MTLSEEQVSLLKNNLITWMQERLQAIGAKNAVVGISGGKDSATVAALAVAAYGHEHVIGVLMPDGAQSDIAYAEDLCDALGIQHEIINISPMTSAFKSALGNSALIKDGISRQTQLNMPPRVRMTLLYAVAQSLDAVVINTSNLSEDWVGYATMYGDTAGAFSPLAMLTTDEVIQLGRALGLEERFVTKPPSDGLTGKTDEDVLGFTYDDLNAYIRTGEVSEDLRAQIDALHKKSRFKFLGIEMFNPNYPIVAEDIAHIYQS
ncbi:MAG: NAD(+) synthase [Peptococcaceae bacterium]|nr:NAD(+) synthase [Peptococcaceae bacterium]